MTPPKDTQLEKQKLTDTANHMLPFVHPKVVGEHTHTCVLDVHIMQVFSHLDHSLPLSSPRLHCLE